MKEYIEELKLIVKQLPGSQVRRKEKINGIIYFLQENPTIQQVKDKFLGDLKNV